MTDFLTEAARLEARIEVVLAEDTAAYLAQRAAEGRDPMPEGWSLRVSERSKALRAQADDIRRRAASAQILGQAPTKMQEEAGVVRAVAPPPATPRVAPIRPAPPTYAHLNREQKIRKIAAGAPFPLPAGAVERAVADGISAEAFGLAVADHCAGARAAAAHAAEVEAVARCIIESDRTSASAHPVAAVEAAARAILEA